MGASRTLRIGVLVWGCMGLAGVVGFSPLLYLGLRKAGVVDHGAGWGALFMRVVLANGAMIVVLLTLHRETSWWTNAALVERVVWLAISVAAGAGAYFLALLLLGVRPAQFRMRSN